MKYFSKSQSHRRFCGPTIALLSLFCLQISLGGCARNSERARSPEASPKQPSRGGTGLAITLPLEGTQVEPGQVIDVAVKVTDGFVPTGGLLIFVGQHSQQIDDPPYRATFTAPDQFAGKLKVFALASNSSGARAIAAREVLVRPSSPIVEIGFSEKEVFIFMIPSKKKILAYARYQDGTQLSLDPTLPVFYTVDEASVATVDQDGCVTTRSVGMTHLRARLGALSASVEIIVREDLGPP